ncbi:MAG: divergent polysaccharide deacetylase family protein [Alphaproteobacteria bacterium]|nr:divergent polysaccharide deacetylase family protein [Alphaproteobacteria bacterium]
MLRALGLFWGSALAIALALGGTLQLLGPPVTPQVAPKPVATAEPHAAPTPAPAPPPAAAPPTAVAPPPAAAKAGPPRPGSPVAAADPALLEPSRSYEGRMLPRIGADQRMPLRAYAAGQDPSETRPRIAVLMADFGPNEKDSEEALRALPPAVSFAVPPNSRAGERLMQAARARGHELLAVIPMEPSDYPAANPGANALLTGAAPAQNALNLEWALSRFTGYAGVTAVLNRMHGERYANMSELYATMLEEIARRGLFYVDPRPRGAAPRKTGMPPYRAIDLVIDAVPVRAELDQQLAQLERIARVDGVALGLLEGPAPLLVDRVSAWAISLTARGIALVPVSAIAAPQQ